MPASTRNKNSKPKLEIRNTATKRKSSKANFPPNSDADSDYGTDSKATSETNSTIGSLRHVSSSKQSTTVSSSVNSNNSTSTRTLRTRNKKPKIKIWLGPNSEFIKLTETQKKSLSYDERTDYHVALDEFLEEDRRIRSKNTRDRNLRAKGIEPPKPKIKQPKPEPKIEYYINEGFKKPPSQSGFDVFYWRYIKDQTTNPDLEIWNMSSTNRGRELLKMEFLIRPADRSYWEIDWYDYPTLKDRSYHMMIMMIANDQDKWETISDFILPEQLDFDLVSKQQKSLYESHYKFGVKPEWLKIDYILNYDPKKLKYLIKWRDLPVTLATYESIKTFNDIENFGQNCIDKTSLQQEITKFHALKDSVTVRNLYKPYKNQNISKKDLTRLKKSIDKDYSVGEQPDWLKNHTTLKLHDYQLKALNWLTFSWAQNCNVILADEMGLGKTIMCINFIKNLITLTNNKGPHLIIVPLSTCENWRREFQLWAPDIECLLYYGLEDERKILKKNMFNLHVNGFKPKETIKFDVLCTSYEIAWKERNTFSKLNWKSVTIDEAHRLKSGTSRLNEAMSMIPTEFKLLLTGTPIQNTMEELFYLLEYLDPVEFNSVDKFLANFNNIDHQQCILKLHELLSSRMLRRTKQDVFKNFVGKTEQIVQVSLNPEQVNIYKAILTKNFKKLNVRHGITNTSGANVLIDLRKVCNHPYLFSKFDLESKKQPNGINYDVDEIVNVSGKMRVAIQMLTKLKAKGHRVLLFTQFLKVLDLWEDICEHYKWGYRRLDGGTALRTRQQGIDDFNKPNSELFIYIISTKAGGLGINLASADTVIFYDHDFNPHNDIQALARSHRLGQKNHVMIYKLVTKDSVEEKLLEHQKQKMMLSHLVVESGRSSMNQLLKEGDLNEILKYGTEKLFKNSATNSSDNNQIIDYDEQMMEDLLDRQKAIEQAKIQVADHAKNYTAEENNILNNYMSEFKVATFKLRVKNDEEIEYERKLLTGELDDEQSYNSGIKSEGHIGQNASEYQFLKESKKLQENRLKRGESDTTNHDYWNNLLQKEYNHELEKAKQREMKEMLKFGRGMRNRTAKEIENLVDHMILENDDESNIGYVRGRSQNPKSSTLSSDYDLILSDDSDFDDDLMEAVSNNYTGIVDKSISGMEMLNIESEKKYSKIDLVNDDAIKLNKFLDKFGFIG